MSWAQRALAFLEQAQGADGSWGYRSGGASFAEPTALAVLARRAHGVASPRATQWLTNAQRADGALAIAPDQEAPHWPTSLAILAWLAAGAGEPASKGLEFLLGLEGKHWPQDPQVGHDTSIVGWPWVAETHSWVEPTSFALWALRRGGRSEHERSQSGRAMLLDRAIPGRGWNYGNTTVLGATLHAYPGPTGVALLALVPEAASDPRVEAAAGWLAGRVATARSPLSLSWSLLGLAAAGRRPPDAPAWLEASFARMERRSLRVADVVLLLLAARLDASLSLLAVTP